ncbi:Globin [Holothuria leucospilota]|uniref:Globin n=1 Tax=Holothuria leucospilota TaxID=206669 RepID=A0A9Q1H613_HOLLE|nr:Globin [Holothuria leucospilota]
MGAAETKTHKSPTEVCKVTGLSNHEKDLIRKSWASFMKNKNENATLLIINLFKMSEGAQDLFSKFKGTNPDELKGSIRVRSHGLRVVAALNSVVENLDDIECLLDMLQHIAHSHHPRGPTKKHFQDLGGVVIATFEQSLGKKLTEDVKNAWVKAYGVILSVIEKEYDVIEGNANEPTVEDAEVAKSKEENKENGEVTKEEGEGKTGKVEE